MIGRRRFVLMGAGSLAALGLGTWELGHAGLQAEVVSMLRRRLNYLHLDTDGLHAFAKDYAHAMFDKRLPTWTRMKYHLQAAVAPSFKRFYRSTDTRSRIARLEDGVVSQYLLSSDFFWNGSDESRPVKYLSYYGAEKACGNPFARRPLQAAAT